MKTQFVFACFFFLAPMLATAKRVGWYLLNEGTIETKNTLYNFEGSGFASIMSDQMFYSDMAGSASPTSEGTFFTPKDYLYVGTGDSVINALTFSFWFYPGDVEGYVWTFTDSFDEDGKPFYAYYSDETLEFGYAKVNEIDDQAVKKSYNKNQWHLVVLTLAISPAKDVTFSVLDETKPDTPIFSMQYQGRNDLSGATNLGRYNDYTSGFSGFISHLSIFDTVLSTADDMKWIFSNTCSKGTCNMCPQDGEGGAICLDTNNLYPVGVDEFAPFQFCSDDCDKEYCDLNDDGATSCLACLIPVDKRVDANTCACKTGASPIFSRGETVDCWEYPRGCKYVDEDTNKCSDCYDKDIAIADPTKDCACAAGFEYTEDSFNYCVRKCNSGDCERCEEDADKCSYCKDPSKAPNDKGECVCAHGYFATSAEGAPLKCGPCDDLCGDCEVAANVCSYCSGRGQVLFGDNCVCDTGLYSTYGVVDDVNFLTCTPCSETCEKCDQNCFMCTDINYPTGEDTCHTASLGYQMKFRRGIIHVKFSEELDKELDKNDFNVKVGGKWRDATDWDISTVSLSEYKIYSNLTKSDLPIEVSFTFEKKEDPKPVDPTPD